ncbi:NADP-dependent oxidoreductase [Rhodococcus sp. HNM0563]|uniref:NADP-dependent oxidoreductase n=1 Tax=Rhodococcus sp. HNM0563 TaxID=2716339 RepID=UPI00146D8E50|nr:NADP-dependent oxidoreductase [Rhodococcus sp. HNM0563]NLU64438.1 NADP-dependent oxidoreductase [Rhodococcus sp. HNM0563]
MALAYGFSEYGGPDTQQVFDLEVPRPGPGQLVVAVHAAGVNPADWKVRTGTRKDTVPVTLPAVLGREVSGVVTAVGGNGRDFSVGDAVFGSTATGFGGYAEYTVLNADSAAYKPEALGFAAAATVPVALGTALDIVEQLEIVDADTVLVLGAGGGVGSAVTQLAHARGAAVLGVTSAGKSDLVESNSGIWIESGSGSDERIVEAGQRVGKVTVIVDLVGGDVLADAAATCGPAVRLISVADPTLGSELGGSGVDRRRTTEVFTRVATLVETGVLDPRIEHTFPLREAGRALALVEEGHARGKVVVTVR